MARRNLFLVLKRKWYEMIDSGIKLEEYRDDTPYWRNRLMKYSNAALLRGMFQVTFQLGYKKNAPRMTFELDGITLGKGREEWGAEPGKEYHIIKLGKRL